MRPRHFQILYRLFAVNPHRNEIPSFASVRDSKVSEGRATSATGNQARHAPRKPAFFEQPTKSLTAPHMLLFRIASAFQV
jgi:hypothetical protein